jgi:HPt (histidine-containing phosphotransfer) domain-containing protein
MEYVCQICEKKFKSSSGLAGHKQLSHGTLAKRQVPDGDVIAENLELALDSLGQLRDDVSEKLSGIEKALEVVSVQQRGLAGTLRHEALKPTTALLDHWANCEDCEKELVLLRSQLAGLVPAPTPPVDPTRWEKVTEWPWQTAEITSDPAVAAQWEKDGEKVREIVAAPTPPPTEDPYWPWEDKKD